MDEAFPPCKSNHHMLFIFLLDNDLNMNQVKFTLPSNLDPNEGIISSNSNLNDTTFLPTSMDASIYFIQQFTKVKDYFKA